MKGYANMIIKEAVVCIFLTAITATLFANEVYTSDSLINRLIWDANFTDALIISEQCRQQEITPEQKALFWLRESDIYLKLGNISASEESLKESQRLISGSKIPDKQVRFQFALQKVKILLFKGKYPEAFQSLRSGEKLVNPVIDPEESSELNALKGDYYYRTLDYASAIKFYGMAADQQNESQLQGKARKIYYFSCLALAHQNTHASERASFYYNICTEYVNNTKSPLHPSLIKIYINLIIYRLKTNNSLTITNELLQKAIGIAKENYKNNIYYLCHLYFLKSNLEFARNDFENALQYCNYVQDLANQDPYLHLFKRLSYSTLISIYFWYKKDYQKAIQFCNLAISNAFNVKSHGFYHYILGLSYNKINENKKAKYHLNKVIKMTSGNNGFAETELLIKTLLSLAQFERIEKNTKQAFGYLNQALIISSRLQPGNILISLIYYEQAKSFLLLTNNYEKALQQVQLSIISGCKTFKDTSYIGNPEISDILSPYQLIESFSLKAYLLFKLYEKNDKVEYLFESLKCQEYSIKLYERTIITINEENSGLNLADLKVKAMNNAVSYATLLYLKTGTMEYGEKALEYAEKSKMQLLLIKTREKSIQQLSGLPDSLIYQEEILASEILEIENMISLNEKVNNPALNTGLLRKLAVLYDQRDKLVQYMEKAFPKYYKAKYSFNLAGLNEIQQMLNEDQVILEYQLLTTEIIIFVISRNDFYIYYQPNDNKIAEAIHSLRQLLILDPIQQEAKGSFLSFVNASSYLYEQLIEPVYERIRNKRLIIIPHNDLTQIPFDILISERPEEKAFSNYRNLKYLIREFPIVYAYSANLLLEKKDEKKKFRKGTAIFLPDYSNSIQGLQPLKGAAAEAAVIKKLSHGKIYNNGYASEENFKSHAGDYRVLHIASHTLLDLKDPSLSCMVMTPPQDSSGDGRLYSYEISQMKLNAQLVMLSGCNTGYGLLRRSEGLISIARSFFYTGVRTIGYTLWPVADNSGFDLIQRFYKQIKKHRTLDVALRDSKLDFLETADPVKTHPYYWANYIIVGRTDRISLGKYPLSAQIAGLLVITVFLILLYRKINR